MKTEACPKPPPELIGRCLATIPESLIGRRPARSRMRLQSRSRARLQWLSLAAAVPIFSVAAIIPARHYLNAITRHKERVLSKQSSILPAGADKLHRYFVFSDFRPVNTNPTRANWFGPMSCRTDVWELLRGHYSDDYINGHQGESGNLFHNANLETVDGTVYRRSGDRLQINHRSASAFSNDFRNGIDYLYNPKRLVGQISGYLSGEVHADGSYEDLPIALEKRGREMWRGASRPLQAEVLVYVQSPSREMVREGAPTIRVRIYRNPTTGLIYGYAASAFWQDGPQIEIGHGDYEYGSAEDAKPYGGSMLDPKAFLRGAEIVSSE